ncbi:TlpA family protein disulfide reductase [Pedobacter sp. R-06]|uniref:TlpA family protein disulfide reductase n=1 Tax=Pedobacter sp. R-06 TaxID=3404051 RepID=UPI003CE945E6
MKKNILTGIMLAFSLCLFAQQKITPLKVGDKVSDDFWAVTHRYFRGGTTTDANLSFLKGKFVIIDFWATWCAPCVQSFPEQSRLAGEFKGKLEILRVTRENDGIVTAFSAAAKNSLGKSLTSVVSDSLLNGLFPHKVIPFTIWIDETGTVQNITDGSELTSANLKLAFQKVFTAPTAYPITPGAPLFMYTHPKNMLAVNMLVKGNIPGLGAGNEVRENEIKKGYLIKNSTLRWVYSFLAMKQYNWFYDQRILLNFKDKDVFNNRYLQPDDLWTVDFWIPKRYGEMLPRLMTDYVNENSGYTAHAEKVDAGCYVLSYKETAGTMPLRTSGGKSMNRLFYPGGKMVNQPILYFMVKALAKSWMTLPIVDETGIDYKVDMEIPVCNNVEELNDVLKKYGLLLTLSSRRMEMLVIDKIDGADNLGL